VTQVGEHYAFGPFRLDVAEGRLSREGTALELPPKAFDALVLLLRNAGHLVDKDRFHQVLWPKAVVSEASLNKLVWQVRRVLGESDDGQRYIETVPKRGYRFIAPLSTQPGDSARETGAPTSAPPTRAPSRARALRLGAALLGAALLLAGAWWWRGHSADPRAVVEHALRRAVAVAPVQVAPSLPGWLAQVAPDMLAHELALSEQLRVLERSGAADVFPALISAASAQGDTTRGQWHALGADTLIETEIKPSERAGDEVRMEVRIVALPQGEVLGEVRALGQLSTFDRVVARAGDGVRARLGVNPLSEALALARLTTLPQGSDVARDYARALRALNLHRIEDGIAALRAMLAREPSFVPGWMELARTLIENGYDAQAAEAAQLGLAQAANAPRALRLMLEGLQAEGSGDWTRATEIYRGLRTVFPDQPEYALRLLNAQAYGGDRTGAEDTLRLLREEPTLAADARVLAAEFQMARRFDDYPRALDAATRLAQRARDLHAPFLQARAHWMRGMVLTSLRENDAARTELEAAARGFAELGDTLWTAKTELLQGNWRMRSGDLAEAERLYRRAADSLGALGARWNQNVALNNLMAIAIARGDPRGARGIVDEVLQSTRTLGDADAEARALVYLAWIELDGGNTDAALAAYRNSADIAEREEQTENALSAHVYIADLMGEMGRNDEALAAAERAQALATERPVSVSMRSLALSCLGRARAAAEQFDGAREALDQAHALALEAGDNDRAARIDLERAQLDIDQAHWQAALERLDSAGAVLRASDSTRDLTTVEALRAQALAKLGQIDQAREALASSETLARDTNGYLDHLPSRMAAVHVAAASGERTKATRLAQQLRRELAPRKFGQMLKELDAALN
jgi:DNA-binding winged helix-turn-helix (wHTH) protein